jgi:hypothetical protein
MNTNDDFFIKRLRRLASLCGVSVPEGDEALSCSAASVIGAITGVVEQAYAANAEAQQKFAEAREEILVSDKLLAERNRVLSTIPACDAHGDQCVPHAIEWIEQQLAAVQVPNEAALNDRRYRRLQVLGAAPCGSKNLGAGTVLRFQSLDAFIDADLKAHATRGEVAAPVPSTVGQEEESADEIRAEFNRVIDFAITQSISADVFLDAWRHGDTSEWPEFTDPDAEAKE